MSNHQPIIEISEDKIAIYTQEKSEIVMWDQAEWEEDPSIVTAIANAIHLAYSQGTLALIETLHTDYIEGHGCPKCFSDDTSTLLATRENRCLKCGHEFALDEKLAQELEKDHDGFSIEEISEPAQGRAFLQYRELCARANMIEPKNLSTFIDIALAEDWLFSSNGKRKYKEV